MPAKRGGKVPTGAESVVELRDDGREQSLDDAERQLRLRAALAHVQSVSRAFRGFTGAHTRPSPRRAARGGAIVGFTTYLPARTRTAPSPSARGVQSSSSTSCTRTFRWSRFPTWTFWTHDIDHTILLAANTRRWTLVARKAKMHALPTRTS